MTDHLKLLTDVLARMDKPIPGQCYMNAQRVTLASHGRLLYHEGTFHNKFKGDLAHAWNSIDGRLVDVSIGTSMLHIFGKRVPEAYFVDVLSPAWIPLFELRRTFPLVDIFKQSQIKWDWMGSSIEYGITSS